MKCRKSYFERHIFCAVLSVLLLIIPLFGQSDPNPNSPTPILISEPDSVRALTESVSISNKTSRQSQSKAFRLNQKIHLFVTNVDLMTGEGANAFRLYAEDSTGKQYRFPVVEIEPLKGREWIYKITVLLKNEIGFGKKPEENGDILLRLAWRGLISNPVKLGLGKTGGGIKVETGITPTPLKQFAEKPEDTEPPTSEYAGYSYSGDRLRFLEQATFGPTDALDQRIRRIGLRVWLNEQFNAQYPTAGNPYPLPELRSSLQTLGCSIYLPPEEKRICDRDYYTMYPLQNWFFKEALYGDAQVRHRVAWALSQIWVISGRTTQQARHMVEYHKVLSKHAFGNYRNLMYEMTLNPGMGNYLDMARSNAYSPNENYAREILQLFSIGLFMLNQDGTLQLDGNGQPIPTYDQETVNNFTKIFTGWSFCDNGNFPECSSAVPGTVNFIDPMYLHNENHNPQEKVLLNYPNPVNQNIPAGQNGYDDLNQALDNIFYHPNVAPFVSRILIQHLVTSDPTPAYVGRVAAAFNNNGFGVRGDMKAVTRAILLDPEARGNKKTDPNYGKLREPVQFMTNILRHFRVVSADAAGQSDGVLADESKKMGQNLFYSTSVFNYYSPGYIIPGTTFNAPEFGVMTTSTTISRANFINKIAFDKIHTGQDAPNGTSIDLTELRQLAQADATGEQLVNELNRKLMHNTMSPQMRSRVLSAVLTVPSFAIDLRARTAFFLVAGSSQYQIQR